MITKDPKNTFMSRLANCIHLYILCTSFICLRSLLWTKGRQLISLPRQTLILQYYEFPHFKTLYLLDMKNLVYLVDQICSPSLGLIAFKKPEWDPTTTNSTSLSHTRRGELSIHFKKSTFQSWSRCSRLPGSRAACVAPTLWCPLSGYWLDLTSGLSALTAVAGFGLERFSRPFNRNTFLFDQFTSILLVFSTWERSVDFVVCSLLTFVDTGSLRMSHTDAKLLFSKVSKNSCLRMGLSAWSSASREADSTERFSTKEFCRLTARKESPPCKMEIY